MVFHHEVYLFEISSLEKDFLRSLSVELKMSPQIISSPTWSHPSLDHRSHTRHSPFSLASPFTPRNVPRTLKNTHSIKTLLAGVTLPDSSEHTEVVFLDNRTGVDPYLILMTRNEPDISNVPLSPCMFPTFFIANKDDSEWHLVTNYCSLNKTLHPMA